MRGVGRDVGEEGLSGPRTWSIHCDRLAEEHVGAVALGLLELAVVQDGRVEVRVARRVAAAAGIGLPDAAAAVDEHFVEAALLGLVGGLVAEMPLAENARGVAGPLEHLRRASWPSGSCRSRS